jgi:anti-sigma factor RsiW
MSFNNNHINIDRNNYEEYFLLYVDNELTPVQRLAVEEFINNHPDLKEELELLSSTVLDAEPIRLFDKDLLLCLIK